MTKKQKHTPRVPLTLVGGIRAQMVRGRMAHQWWGQRWLSLLEQIMPGPRLGRGRSYAAMGQVAELRLGAGMVSARVQGGSAEPYQVEILFATLAAAGARRVLASLPPLLKGYLRLGGVIGDGAVIDRPFNTTDVLVVVNAADIAGRYVKRFSA